MREDTIVYKVYKFEELSREAKDKAISAWYEHEDYPWLEEDMKEELKYQLTEAGIETVDGLEIQYSLSWCQGDGACFTGTFKHAGFYAHIKHTGQYYHSRSVDFEFEKTLGEEDTVGDDKALSAFIDLYRGICTKLENYGYSILEYRMTDEEFADCCDSNEYEFHEDGRMY